MEAGASSPNHSRRDLLLALRTFDPTISPLLEERFESYRVSRRPNSLNQATSACS